MPIKSTNCSLRLLLGGNRVHLDADIGATAEARRPRLGKETIGKKVHRIQLVSANHNGLCNTNKENGKDWMHEPEPT
jgi:hypothetical protein